jgi:hypothetical protein
MVKVEQEEEKICMYRERERERERENRWNIILFLLMGGGKDCHNQHKRFRSSSETENIHREIRKNNVEEHRNDLKTYTEGS